MKRAARLIPLLLLLPFAQAGPIDALLGDPDAARGFDYCSWRFSGGSDGELPDFDALMESETEDRRLRSVILAEAGTTVALAAKHEKACKKALAAGAKQHERAMGKAIKRMPSKFDQADDPKIAAIQKEIHDLWVRDQAGRNVYIESQTEDEAGADYWARRLAVADVTGIDNEATARMRELVEAWDWIDVHRFGTKTSNHAWILVQHADDHPEFQQQVLDKMTPHLEDGGVSKQNYAYLWDRVAVNHDREQRYGTQPDWECKDGKLELMPVEDLAGLAARRAEMGLGPVEEALAGMAAAVCR